MYDANDLQKMAYKLAGGIPVMADREDAMQDAIIAAWQVGEKNKDREGVRALQYKTLAGKIKNYIRDNKKHNHASLDAPINADGDSFYDITPADDTPDTRSENMGRLDAVLHLLGDTDRQVIRMLLDNVPVKEIASTLGITFQAVYNRRNRAVQSLRAKVAQAC